MSMVRNCRLQRPRSRVFASARVLANRHPIVAFLVSTRPLRKSSPPHFGGYRVRNTDSARNLREQTLLSSENNPGIRCSTRSKRYMETVTRPGSPSRSQALDESRAGWRVLQASQGAEPGSARIWFHLARAGSRVVLVGIFRTVAQQAKHLINLNDGMVHHPFARSRFNDR